MGVDGDARDVEGVAEDHVGRLAADAGQRHQLAERVRQHAVVLLDDGGAEPDERVGLVPEEPGAVDHLLQLGAVGLRVVAAPWGSVANSAGVTELTSLSVLCADRIVATASSSGVVKSSSQCASGWVAARVRSIRPTRRARPSDGSPSATRLASRARCVSWACGAVAPAGLLGSAGLREAVVTTRRTRHRHPTTARGAEPRDPFVTQRDGRLRIGIGHDGARTPARAPGGGARRIASDMTAWLSVLVPLLVMFFALGMERVESKLREATVRPEELEELLERPRPDELRALFRQGTGRALELFRLRNRGARAGARPSAAELPDAVRSARPGRARRSRAKLARSCEKTAVATSRRVRAPPRLTRR